MKRFFPWLASVLAVCLLLCVLVLAEPEGEPTAAPTPTQSATEEPKETPEETPVETPAETPEATPDEPTEEPEETPEETPEEGDVTPTPNVTKKPTSKPKTTKDPGGTGGGWENTDPLTPDPARQTNEPPALPSDINLGDYDIATPVAEAPTETKKPSAFNSDPSFGLFILFLVLFLLLILDIGAILLRRFYTGEGQVNGGVSRRRVRDDLTDDPGNE